MLRPLHLAALAGAAVLSSGCATTANGGSVTLVAACSSGTLVIERNTPLTQTSVFADNMPIPFATFGTALDKLTEISQEQASVIQIVNTAVTALNTGARVSISFLPAEM